jgi:hypothetical protein
VTLGRTVANPVIGLGLDANPLKAGLRDAKASVAGAVAGIKISAAELARTKFVTAFADKLKPSDYNLKATVQDLATHYGKEIQTRFGELKTKFSESQTGKDLIADFGAFWAKLAAGWQRVRSSGFGRGVEFFGAATAKNVGTFAQGSGLNAMVAGLGAALAPSLRIGAGGAWSGLKMGGRVADAGITRLANLPATLSGMAMPLNQTLELVGKAQRLLGAPVRAMTNWEANNDREVMAGGRSALNSTGWSGTLARFSAGVEEMFANILNALDKTFNFKGWIEAARGAMDGVTRIIEGFFGPLDQAASGENNFEEMFMAGQDVAIDLSQQMVEFLSNIYNTSLDAYEQLLYIYNVLAHPLSNDAFYKGLKNDLFNAGLRDQKGNKLGRIDIDKDVGGFFRKIREGLDYDRMLNQMFGVKNFHREVSKKEQDEANKSLQDMTRNALGAGDAFTQIRNSFTQAEEEIARLANAGGSDQMVAAARAANEQQRDLAIIEQLKPIMAANDNAKFSQALEMNSAALIESIMRAQMPSDSRNPQERIAAAAEVQKNLLTQMKTTQEQMLAAVKLLPRNAAVFVGPIAP